MNVVFIFLISISGAFSKSVPISDNILFAFERCRTLKIELEKGELKEEVAPSFDLHCKRIADTNGEVSCSFFDPGSNVKKENEVFSGGSDLGRGELTDKKMRRIRFLIGKNFASFESPGENKACIGIFIFEQDALKQRASSLKSGLSN